MLVASSLAGRTHLTRQRGSSSSTSVSELLIQTLGTGYNLKVCRLERSSANGVMIKVSGGLHRVGQRYPEYVEVGVEGSGGGGRG